MRTFVIVFFVLLWIGSILLVNAVNKGGGFFTRMGKKASNRSKSFRSEFVKVLGVKQQIYKGLFSFYSRADSVNDRDRAKGLGEIATVFSSFSGPLTGESRILEIDISNSLKKSIILKESSVSSAAKSESMPGTYKYQAILLIPGGVDRNLIPDIRNEKIEVGDHFNPVEVLKNSFDFNLKVDNDEPFILIVVLRLQPNGSQSFVGADWAVVEQQSEVWSVKDTGTCMCLTEYTEIELKKVGRSNLRAQALLYGGYVADVVTAPVQAVVLFVYLLAAAIFRVCR